MHKRLMYGTLLVVGLLLAACGDPTATTAPAATTALAAAATTAPAMTGTTAATGATTAPAMIGTTTAMSATTAPAMAGTTAAMSATTAPAMTGTTAAMPAGGTTAAMMTGTTAATSATTASAAALNTTPGVTVPAGAGTEAEKQELVMALVPSRQSDVIATQADNIANFLSKETGYKIKPVVLSDYAAMGEGMNSKNIDFGWTSPLQYVIAAKKFGVYPITGSVRSGKLGYKAFVVARTDSGINTLADLKGKTVILGDKQSASSYLYPTDALTQAGLKAGVDYNVRNISNQSAIATTIVEKGGDAGAFYDDARTNKEVTDKYPNVLKDTKIIYTSPLIPADPQIVRKDLNAAQVQKLQAALLKLATTDEGKKYIKDLFTIDSLAVVSDADYAPLRDTINRVAPDLIK